MKDRLNIDPKKLIRLAKNGDRDSFGKLYELYYVPVFRYVYFRVRKKEDTQDLVEIVFLKVYKSIKRYEEKGKDPLSFFFTVARNTVIDYLRKRETLSLDEEIPDQIDVESYVERQEESEIVQKAIQSLSENQKEVIILKFISGFSNEEISKQIGKKEDAIRQIQYRALKALKEKLKNL